MAAIAARPAASHGCARSSRNRRRGSGDAKQITAPDTATTAFSTRNMVYGVTAANVGNTARKAATSGDDSCSRVATAIDR